IRKAQRCWQPSWIFRNARDRPWTRARGATSSVRARATSPTWTRSATRPSSSSARRCLSVLPTIRSTSPNRATSSGRVCAQQPVTTSRARGFTRAARRIAWRSESSARAVTAQVFTTTTSAGSPKGTVRKPRDSSTVWSCWVSTWLSRQPSVANETVRAVMPRSCWNRLAQLAARGTDILALAPPDRRRQLGVEQNRPGREVPRAVDRHKLRADLVGRGVERDRQVHLEVLATELLDPGHEPHGRDGDPPRRVAEAELGVGQNPERLHERREIGEGLAHSHE